MEVKKPNMETIVMCIYGEGENCDNTCPMFKKCWSQNGNK